MRNLSLNLFLGGFVLLLVNCYEYRSQSEHDDSAGMNGGFEVVKNGLPVNWLFTAESNDKSNDFDVVSDSVEFKEGKRSLRFSVRRCSPEGGWKSPGFGNEFFGSGEFVGPAVYLVSVWVKNSGANARFLVGKVDEKNEYQYPFDQKIGRSPWQKLEYKIFVEKGSRLRVELEILSAGVFWMDDFRVEKLTGK